MSRGFRPDRKKLCSEITRNMNWIRYGGTGHGGSSVDMFLRNYKLGKMFGIGSFGKVKIAEHALTGQKVAIKILNVSKIKKHGHGRKGRNLIRNDESLYHLFVDCSVTLTVSSIGRPQTSWIQVCLF
ncbi:hypothetical protein L6452_04018 [Arctium lappa]|uniref:Uncharacterized protein n=1 Tax=Arctium lappa TaxID=4217 RepID=A0ACB9FN92_ARCLA|nr:hypothetical protein L6452_04018 [Arctium lappa]